ncbi:hypothetical protein AGMMS50249_4180 [candidate division SR1 bacterium]|nr:hypothetical protein AGMMS50249_4180 [candidate division SR1 bacterium]
MKRAILTLFLFSFLFSVVNAAERNLDGVNLITRSQRGADETIRYKDSYPSNPASSSSSTPSSSSSSSAIASAGRAVFMRTNFPNDRSYDKTNSTLDGHTLIYPDQINNNKTKIVVHHTATTYDQTRNTQQIQKAIQQIYKYHTLDRDFGDIGYNFLIDHLGNIYEGRAGGEGAAGMHVSYNNVATLGISLLGNFEEYSPTQAQINALTDLITALSKKYDIDPSAYQNYFQPSNTAPYVIVKNLPTIVGHGDIAATACPGDYLHTLLPFIRSEVKNRRDGNYPKEVILKGLVQAPARTPTTTVSPTNTATDKTSNGLTFSQKLSLLQSTQQPLLSKVISIIRSRYSGNLQKASNLMNKMTYKYNLSEIKNLTNSDISVLLYELTTKYRTFDIQCENLCAFILDGNTYQKSSATLSFTDDGIQVNLNSDILSAQEIIIKSDNNLISITNYDRVSYAKIPRNTFHGSLIFHRDNYQTLDGMSKNDFVVINQLSFSDYMRGIVESNDTETLEKNKVMALIAKNYALFYLEKKNLHPNIPANATFSAIDSPEMFQKYVGAGAEKTLTKRYQALKETENLIITYDNYLPILPYFSCSAGFTLSAQEKRGWQDTPRLQSVYDFSACKDFSGHGVGLAGQGAEYFAKQGMTAQEILKWYYPGIQITSL